MVYVPEEWRDRLPAKDSTEQAMLEFCPHVDESSRLSCQIKVTAALDGLRLKVPDSQQ
jgi:2Fe-2S ferredoxin